MAGDYEIVNLRDAAERAVIFLPCDLMVTLVTDFEATPFEVVAIFFALHRLGVTEVTLFVEPN
ncbi:hypothetical protein LJB89_02945 [Tyzzerella sp. OttesenSCG-928-J15]|nr:hypothetical protein [Tyzzerella sp. OttesenSCG-928-J15]